jgi:hypothetical protein
MHVAPTRRVRLAYPSVVPAPAARQRPPQAGNVTSAAIDWYCDTAAGYSFRVFRDHIKGFSRLDLFHIAESSNVVSAGTITSGGASTSGSGFTAANTQPVKADILQAASRPYLGSKKSDGTKITEMRGDFVISGTTFWTTQPSSGINNSSLVDAFDVAEVFSTDSEYPAGTVICPDDGAIIHRSEHDGCLAALIVSKAPGLALDGGKLEDIAPSETHKLLAVAGRGRVQTSDTIKARQLVCADSKGGVRGKKPGEQNFALGYALDMSADGQVSILVRPIYCRAPQ